MMESEMQTFARGVTERKDYKRWMTHYCIKCNKNVNFSRSFCSQECHDSYYDDLVEGV